MVEETAEAKEETKTSKKSITEKVRENPWVLSTFVMGLLIVILLITSSGSLTGKVISENKIGEYLLNYYESMGAEGLTVDSVEKVSGLYKVNFEYQGAIVPVYITKDGKLTGNLNSLVIEEEGEVSEPTTFSEEQNALIQEFSSCLYNKGMRVYYAGWCGHCHNLIETFGGLENAGKMMIECQTEDRQAGTGAVLCERENITGFPTIKINGQAYSSARTFEAFAEATGCVAPQL